MKTTKKLLSVLLSVLMIWGGIAGCFTAFAASAGVAADDWNALANALANDTVANADFDGTTNYTVSDPDGKIIAAVEAYWTVFQNLADKTPANRNAGNRTINQVNDSIKAEMQSRMGSNYTTYNVAVFLTGLASGASVTADATLKEVTGQNSTNKPSAPSSPISAPAAITLTVNLDSVLLSYEDASELPENVITSKSFTVTHKVLNDYDSYDTNDGGCSSDTYDHKFQFYYAIDTTTSANGASISTKVITDSATALAPYEQYLDDTLAEAVDLGLDFLNTAEADITAAKAAVVNAFGNNIWKHFFDDAAVTAGLTLIDDAQDVFVYQPVADAIAALVAAGYAGYNKAQLETLKAQLEANYNQYMNASEKTRAFIEENGFDLDGAIAFYNAVVREIELIELRELKAAIDAQVGTFTAYDEDGVLDGTVTAEMLNIAKGTVDGWVYAIGTYVAANVEEVMPGYKTALSELSAELNRLSTIMEYDMSFAAKYADFVADVYVNTNGSTADFDLFAAAQNYDEWYTGLKSLIATIEGALGTDLAEKIFDDLDTEMKAHMDTLYVALHERVSAQIDVAYDLYMKLKAVDMEVAFVNLLTFSRLEKVLGDLEKDVYDFLLATNNFNMPQETIDKYNALAFEIFDEFHAFLTTGGFKAYQQSKIEYQDREVSDLDIVRNDVFDVTDEKLTNIIEGIDNLINTEMVSELLGGLINEDGSPLNIGEMIKSLLKDMLFTDSFINTLVGALYPLILEELIKVWEKELPNAAADADIDIMSLLSKDIVTVVNDAGLALYPSQYATHVYNLDQTKYADVYNKLKNADTGYDVTKEYEVDENGATTNVIADVTVNYSPWTAEGASFLKEDGSLDLVWGVDALKESGASEAEVEAAFYAAFDDAFDSLKPLFNALLAGKKFDKTINGVVQMGSGLLSAGANLGLSASGNSGYANLLVPIFELIGAEFVSPATFESYAGQANSLEPMLKAILNPIFSVVDKLAAAPLDTVLGLLPNLCYALSMQMLTPLLNMLKTTISLSISLTGMASLISGCVSDMLNSLPSMDLAIGDMLDLNDLGIDLSGGINTLLASLGVALPEIDQITLATLGTLTAVPTQRYDCIYDREAAGISNTEAYTIVADKAGVAYYLLTYALGLIQDEEAFTGLLSMLMTTENEAGETVPDEEKIAEVLATLDEIGLREMNIGDALAAVVELFNPVEYENAHDAYTWYDGSVGGTVETMTPAIQVYLTYNSNWTRAASEYIIDNLDGFIGEIIDLAGSETLSELFTKELNAGLYTNANITSLAKALGGLEDMLAGLIAGEDEAVEGEEDAALALDIDIVALIADATGINLADFAIYADLADDYNWGFKDGDSAGFINALIDVLAPFAPIVNFLIGGDDLVLLDDMITVVGYDAYDSAFAPLLEALYCDVKALEEGDDILRVLLETFVAKMDALCADPIGEILNTLPGLFYFLASNGLSTFVRNLLTPVYALLDVIRPIYNVEFDALIEGLLADELGIFLNLDDINIKFVLDLVNELAGLDLVGLDTVIYDLCKIEGFGVAYDSVSSLLGENAKRGSYTEGIFDGADMITVIVGFVYDWLTVPEHAAAFDELVGVENLTEKLFTIFESVDPTYEKINWMYYYGEDYDFTEMNFEAGISVQPTIYALTYPNNWTEATAQYIGDNLDTIISDVLKATGSEYESLAALLQNSLTIYSSENVQALADMLNDLLGQLGNTLVTAAGMLLEIDTEGLAAYVAPEGIDTKEEFAAALADLLGYADGLLNWLLFGEDYTLFNATTSEVVATLDGAEGYKYGLGVLLEALGVEAPDTTDLEEILLAALTRVDEIFANPAEEILDLLPNLIYFINTNGVATVINNTAAAAFAFIDKLAAFDVELNLSELIGFDLENLTLANLFPLVEEELGMDLTPVSANLVNFYAGTLKSYLSVSGEYGFKMLYDTDMARYDMITILVTVLLQTVQIEENAEVLKDLLGEDIYKMIIGLFNMTAADIKTIDYKFTEHADDPDYIFSALETSELFTDFTYGPLYTEEMAQYIADNFGEFIDNLLYLLGIKIDGEDVNNLEDLLNGLIGTSVYNSDIVITLRDALVSVAGSLDEMDGGAHIKAVLKNSLGVDLDAFAAYEVPAFTNDREQFVAALCDLLAPFYPVLGWALANQDFTFFVNEDETDAITLLGAEGYAYGIVPLLEALGCQNLVSSADYCDAVAADPTVLLTSILNPLLDKIDIILADPANEIFAMLPNLIYFINSNGLDTVFKNTLNAVYTVLNAIEPIAMVDIYDLLGIRLDEMTFESLMALAFDMIAESTGYQFTLLDISPIAELTTGKLVSYTSANGETAYTMVYADDSMEGSSAEMVTVILRLLVEFINRSENAEMVLDLMESELGMTTDARTYVGVLFGAIQYGAGETAHGIDASLATLYYVFYGVDTGVDETTGFLKDLNAKWQQILEDLGKSDDPNELTIGNMLAALLDYCFDDIFDSEGLASNGLIKFFEKLIELFKNIINWFKNMFS